jgi:hypothetical protein
MTKVCPKYDVGTNTCEDESYLIVKKDVFDYFVIF